MTPAQVQAKFNRFAADAVGEERRAAIIAEVERLETAGFCPAADAARGSIRLKAASPRGLCAPGRPPGFSNCPDIPYSIMAQDQPNTAGLL